MAVTLLQLSNGEWISVAGDLESVEKTLSDAARSGSRLARFKEASGGEEVAVNPEHVAFLRPGQTVQESDGPSE